MEQKSAFSLREPRLPLFVQVATDPPLPDCWSVNISRTGLGLVSAGGVESRMREGEPIGIELQLPGSGDPVRAKSRIMWMYGRPARSGEGVETAIGVEFTKIAGTDRLAFDRYLLEHRFHVAVGLAAPVDQRLMEEVFEAHSHLHFEDSQEGLIELVGRGDISTVVLWGGQGAVTPVIHGMVTSMLEADGSHVLPPDLMPSIIYCGPSSSDDLVELFNSGRLYRALHRPIDQDALRVAVQRACSAHGERTEQRRVAHSLERALLRQRASTRSEASLSESIARRMVFESPAMQRVVERANKVAGHKVSVLLQGETGTGKEVLATLLHELSPRTGSSLVIQDCGVLTETLLESELFGHVKGAFTGAVADHPGLFVMADGGTVFLDEIENTTPDFQAKLLRVIETGMLRPVGGTKVRHVDVRLIAATNRDLRAAVEAGRFREDLYYRLNTFPIHIPPLRERTEDILPLAEHFLRLSSQKMQRHAGGFSPAARQALAGYGWPGNIRELRNAVEAALLLCEEHQPIEPDHLPDAIRDEPRADLSEQASLRGRVRAFERELIRRTLEQNNGVLRRAAKQLGTNPVTLRRKALDHGLVSSPSPARK